MKKEVGLWIDHQEAILVSLQNGREETRKITINIEKKVQYSHSKNQGHPYGSQNLNNQVLPASQPEDHKGIFFNSIVEVIGDADSIWIFGPDNAKRELETRLKKSKLKSCIMGIETIEKMTIPQIISKVNTFYGRKE
jgi:hypothetical protein